MKDKIWTKYDLEKRDRVAASAAAEIASSMTPRATIERLMPELMKYEILSNIVWDMETDDGIRQFATEKISPPSRLSQAANIEYFNKYAMLTVHQCIMLQIDVDPRTPSRTQVEMDLYSEIFHLAHSYAKAHQEPFSDWHDDEPFWNYEIQPDKFFEFIEKKGYSIPVQWQSIGLENQSQDSEPSRMNDGLKDDIHIRRRNEILGAAINMLCVSEPRDQQDILNFMRENSDWVTKYSACFRRTVHDKTLISSITRAGGNVLDDPQYRDALMSADNTDSADRG